MADLAKASGLDTLDVNTQSELHEASTYLTGDNRENILEARDQAGTAGSPSVFGRLVDHVLVPYAKAIAAEGYRFSPDRFAERFGLTDEQREQLRTKLMSSLGKTLTGHR